MRGIKLTKAELKAQTEALNRYMRFLPTLQLKKERLHSEVRRASSDLDTLRTEQDTLWAGVHSWVALFAEDIGLQDLIQIHDLSSIQVNIAGTAVTRLERIEFADRAPDLRETPPWADFGWDMARKLIRLQIEIEFREQELAILTRDLRAATQRVNLFEKIKIPACRENIRIIRIALGEEQTAAIARAKLAKAKTQEWSTGA